MGRSKPARSRAVGTGRTELRNDRLVVSARRRPLYGLHLRRRSRARLRRRRARILCRPLRDDRLPHRADRAFEVLEHRSRSRLRHDGRLRARPVRRPRARDRDRSHGRRSGVALHRPSARRNAGGLQPVQHAGSDARAPRADGRLRSAGRLHVHERPARARHDRVREGHADLRDRHRGDYGHSRSARRLGARLFPLGGGVGRPPETLVDLPRAAAVLHVRIDGIRLGAFALYLSTLDHERARGAQPRSDPPQRGTAADLLTAFGSARAAGVLRPGGRHLHERHDAASYRSSSRASFPIGSSEWPTPPSRSARSSRRRS